MERRIIFRITNQAALTPALSHPMGEGERFTLLNVLEASLARDALGQSAMRYSCPLSHRMGEGQGEGSRLCR